MNHTTQPTLSLVTYNTLGTPFFAPDITKRYKKIASLINKSKYDVVCMQEVLTYYHLYLLRSGLTNFPFVSYQKNPLGPRGGLVIFSKINLTNQSFFNYGYPKDGFVPWYARVAQHGILSCTLPSLSIRLATTHLSSDQVHDLTEKNKFYKYIGLQSREAAVELNRSEKKYGSVILVGDFNIAKGSELYQEFLKLTNATDLFANDKEMTYTNDRVPFFYTAPPNRIDTMYIKSKKKRMKALKTEHILVKPELLSNGKKGYLSDHIGLHCILEVHK